MNGQKNYYDSSFKLQAVELSYERSNISELARELGIKASLLYKWRKIIKNMDPIVFQEKTI